MARYDLGQVARILNTRGVGPKPLEAFRIDSRQVGRGDLFFALRGQKVDGHDFLAEVADRGAAAAVVDRSYAGKDHGLALLRVVDVVEALQALARHRIGRHPAKVVAVTGSVGKTTTKDFLAELLRSRYRVGVSKGNSNSQVGLPLTILNDLSGDEEVVVLEMGMTHPGNLSQLLSIAPADISVLTTVALVHAENHDSLEAIARAKAEIFSHPKTQLGILHRDMPGYAIAHGAGSCRKVSFSLDHPEADFRLDDEGDGVVVVAEGTRYELGHFPIPGVHHKLNLLAAVAAAQALGISWGHIAEALPRLRLPERRMEFVEKGGILFLNDSYNACEVSVKAALASLPAPASAGRRVAVLGAMPELGPFSAACHEAVGRFALDKVDAVFCLGQECQPIIDVWKQQRKPAQLFTDRGLLVRELQNYLKVGDVALLKGANSKKMWEILDEIVVTR